MNDLSHAERVLLLKRGKPWFPNDCHENVQAALVRSNYTRRPHGYRFLDSKQREVTRGGHLLSDFDLEPLFDAGEPDAFVRDGRFAKLVDALAQEDAFVDRNKTAALIDRRAAYKRWRTREWSEEVQMLLDTTLAHGQRRFTGWSPDTGRLQRTRDNRDWQSPLDYQADGAREIIHDGLFIGHLTRPDSYHFTGNRVAQLMVDGPTGVVVAFTDKGQLAGRSTLGALVFGSGLLTAFEARRVSWLALKRIAGQFKNRFRVGWYATKAHWASRGTQHLLDFTDFEVGPSPAEIAANWLAVVSCGRVTPAEVPLPEFEVDAIESPDARLVAGMVRNFWIGNDVELQTGARSAKGRCDAVQAVAQALVAASANDGRFGYLFDTAERRALLINRWRAAHE